MGDILLSTGLSIQASRLMFDILSNYDDNLKYLTLFCLGCAALTYIIKGIIFTYNLFKKKDNGSNK